MRSGFPVFQVNNLLAAQGDALDGRDDGAGAASAGLDEITKLLERDGAWTLVEFKTDEVRDRAAFERVVAEKGYREQVRRYARACERLLGARPRCLLVMLDYGGAVRAVELS